MRMLCDVCESAAAIIFCAADEAALCCSCDEKVHMCNKLANRHVRVGLAEPSEIPRCDICENAPAFFYCEIDGSSLCLQCDMIVHVGGKRTHGRYLLLRQKVEFMVDKSGRLDEPASHRVHLTDAKESARFSSLRALGNQSNPHVSPNTVASQNVYDDEKMENKFIDLNSRPQKMHVHGTSRQELM